MDNRRSNLRIVSRQQNSANLPPQTGSSSPFKGVGWDASREKWSAKISVDGRTINLGRFDHAGKAAYAYDVAARKHFGEFAWLNGAHFLTPREALQSFGTSWGRARYENIWAALGVRKAQEWCEVEYRRAVQRRLSAAGDRRDADECDRIGVELDLVPIAVITDCRFKNEAKIVKEAGGVIWQVERAEETDHLVRPSRRRLEGSAAAHASEQERLSDEFQAMVDERIVNYHSSFEDLRVEVAKRLNALVP